jgi:hypothetical protein
MVGGGGFVAGATIYSVNTSAEYTAVDYDAANNVNFRYESLVSGFFCGMAISENTDGVSVYAVGLNSAQGSGNTVFCYDGSDIDGNTAAEWQVSIAGVTVFATPAIGTGVFDNDDNNYSGNSLFVVDGQGGVSVFNKATGAADVSTIYGANSGAVSFAGPVTNGRYLVLCTDTGVTVYDSNTASNLDTGNSSSWLWRTGTMTKANGWDENYRVYATPSISNNRLILAVGSPDGFGNERLGAGKILIYNLSQTAGTTVTEAGAVDAYFLPVSPVASPIVSGSYVWIPTYKSAIYRILFADSVNGYPYWRQFKFDAGKTGHSTESVSVVYDDDDSGCFISTIK